MLFVESFKCLALCPVQENVRSELSHVVHGLARGPVIGGHQVTANQGSTPAQTVLKLDTNERLTTVDFS